MGTLDTAIRAAERWDADRQGARAELVRYIQAMLAGYEEAKTIWQGYLETNPQAPVTGSRWTILNWIGSDRAHRLWTLNRQINEHFAWIARLTGAALPWSFPTDEVMIDAADKQIVQSGSERGAQAARVAIQGIEERIGHARTLLQEIEAMQ